LGFVLGLACRAEAVAREGWRPGLDSNQDKERCTALAWKAFRHRAVAIIADHAAVSHD